MFVELQRPAPKNQQFRLCGVGRDFLIIISGYPIFRFKNLDNVIIENRKFDRGGSQINADLIMLLMSYKRSLLNRPAARKIPTFFIFFSRLEVSGAESASTKSTENL